jgi:hypothetical protein|tara:strand:- start:57 stop:668 length:612 start_codon:yes stop_codon:yes gene_type:complete
MTSRLVVNSVRHTGASADGITLDASGNVTFPANATCSGTATGFGGGKMLQVVQTVKSDTASTTSTSFTDISGTSVSITPSSSSHKVLVIAFLGQFVQASDVLYIALTTGDGTGIIQGDTASGKESVATACYHGGNSQGEAYYGANPATIVMLHSPSTTSAVTYKLRWRVNNNSSNAYLNRNVQDSNQYAIRTATTITAMEVGA